MSELKTNATDASVIDFLNAIAPPIRKIDGLKLLRLFKEATNEEPVMWGPSIVGFGAYKYIYPSGKELEWFPVGFSPRKQAITIYIMLENAHLEPFLANLGKHKKSKGCLYINTLADIDEVVLREMIRTSINLIKTKNQ
ncbi:uncharacterized protein DUF1801 [Algoriphagus ratkowskyi]|uniref:DUF1801 domain-containing protein n=1 Tax=Algoriphagus ratkowskyi TaxID=57028 RepID=A0A2W7S3V0_9BACT|nr:DUF1801 domain-containing protein [Algoriphagus ratkowskyi]PZX57715.1 uncharacterized protein DUF1801 [Algoriphagus ratkowskyi]TXD78984.1 DUF1801 domain-containing protein [Algoriphagus ratkowskyi]